jgi:rod shape-determining protein MreC
MRQEISSKTHVGMACVAFFLLSLFLTAYSAKNPAVARLGSNLVLRIVAPISGLAEYARSGVISVISRYVYLVGATANNESLKARVLELETRLASVSEAQRENTRLREVLKLGTQLGLVGVTANVVGRDPSGWVKGIVVNRGAQDGVREGMAVLHPRGIVGQVISTSAHAARVLLVSDHASGVDVLVQGSRARGVLEGAGDQICELKFVAKEFEVKEGEPIITSGMDRIYPKGLLAGHVAAIGQGAGAMFRAIEVRPAVDFSRIEEVLIVAGQNEGSASGVSPDSAQGR